MIQERDQAKIIWYFIEIADLLKKNGEIICAREGITIQQWLIMLYLAGDPNIPFFQREKHVKPLMASELAEAFNVSRPNITNLINNLLKKELITQVADDIDRRKKRLKLTSSGTELLEKMEPGRRQFNNNLLSIFSPEQINNLLSALIHIDQTIINHFNDEKTNG